MAKTICVECREVFETRKNSADQDKMGDEFFCPSCWKNLRVTATT